MRSKEDFNYAVAVVALLLVSNIGLGDAKRTYGSNRKTSTSSNSGHVTRPTYNNNNGASSGSNSHADVAKLSYPNYNSQPNRPATATGGQNQAPIGWNAPKQQGPPPAYSASNPAGGAHTNMHEAAPAYKPNNAAPPSYGAASGSNVHTPITATNQQGVHNSYPSQQYNPGGYNSPGALPAGATYHSPGALPAGASYYPSAGHVPAGGGYYPGGGYPAGGSYYPGGGGHMPAGATYLPAGAAMPAGATYYSQPPQQSSGLGFGSGLAAGAIGGALLGHALTPTHTRVVEQAPMNGGGGGGDDKIIIINNGPPGSVTTTSAGGATVITTGAVAGQAVNSTDPAAPADAAPAPLAPFAANPNPPAVDGAQMPPQMPPGGPAPEQPPPGGIICMPVRLNETDPNDSEKMIEVEKVACYPAPPPPPPVDANGMPVAAPADGSAPLAPMEAVPGQASQQLQQSPTQATLLPEQSSVRVNGAAAAIRPYAGLLLSTLVALLLAFGRQ